MGESNQKGKEKYAHDATERFVQVEMSLWLKHLGLLGGYIVRWIEVNF